MNAKRAAFAPRHALSPKNARKSQISFRKGKHPEGLLEKKPV
jgi:hypothetical protein